MRILLIFLLASLLPTVMACSPTGDRQPTPTSSPTPVPTATPTPTPVPTATPIPSPSPTAVPTPAPVTPTVPAPVTETGTPVRSSGDADIIIDAIIAMQQVKSFHAEVDAAFKVVQTEASFRMDEESFGTEFPILFSGDFQMPDRAAGTLQVALGIVALELDIITIGQQAYITNPETGFWEQYPLAFTGMPDPYDLVLLPSEANRYSEVQVVSDQLVDGVQTRRVRANLRANVLGGSYEILFLEVWIGEEDNLIRRLTMTGETEVDEQDSAGLASGALGAADIGGKAEFIMTITYTDFDKPVSIEPPIP